MRSSSKAPRRPALSVSAVEFTEWTPDALSACLAVPASAAEHQAMMDQAVELAISAERLAAEEREAEMLTRERTLREQAVREAYDQGHVEGREEGELAEAARLRSATRAAEEILDALREGEVRWSGTIEENVCALAVIVARQVIGVELKADVEVVAELVRNALTEFPVDQPIRIRINPADLNALSSIGAADADPLAGIVGDRESRWLADSSIAPGGCIVEGRERIIDGRVDTALERVYRRLTYTNA